MPSLTYCRPSQITSYFMLSKNNLRLEQHLISQPQVVGRVKMMVLTVIVITVTVVGTIVAIAAVLLTTHIVTVTVVVVTLPLPLLPHVVTQAGMHIRTNTHTLMVAVVSH
jgi:hypothetical protein